MIDYDEMDEEEQLGLAVSGVVDTKVKEYKWVCPDCSKELGTSLIVGLPEVGTCNKCKRQHITTYEVYKR